MGKEIERKFLLKEQWKELVKDSQPALIRQGYLATDAERTVRVRLKDKRGYLTIKGKTMGISRQEFEYEIPAADAGELLILCKKPLIEKKRYSLKIKGQLWEIDEFFGDNEGLVLAEAELENEEQMLEIPEWVAKEVTTDKRYFNSRLQENPYRKWPETTNKA